MYMAHSQCIHLRLPVHFARAFCFRSNRHSVRSELPIVALTVRLVFFHSLQLTSSALRFTNHIGHYRNDTARWENRSWCHPCRCRVCVRTFFHVHQDLYVDQNGRAVQRLQEKLQPKWRIKKNQHTAAIIQLLQSSQVRWTCKSWLDWCTCFHFPTDKMRSRQYCCRCCSVASPCSISTRLHNNHLDWIFRPAKKAWHAHTLNQTKPNTNTNTTQR